MPVQPHLVVGVAGVLLLLITGGLVAANWRSLTDTQDYEATVELVSYKFPEQRSGSLNPGTSTTVSLSVPFANVTYVYWHLYWQERASGPGAAQHDVTATLRDPQGRTVFSETDRGGVDGIRIEKTLREAPEGSRFTATPDTFESRYGQRYETIEETNGTWSVDIAIDTPSGFGAQGIDYDLWREEIRYFHVTVTRDDGTATR